MAEALVLSLVEGILSELGSYTVPYIQFVVCFDDEKKKLMETLATVKAILKDAEKQEKKSHADEDWFGKLQLILYDADDLVDLLLLHNTPHASRNVGKRALMFFSSIRFHISMAFKMKGICDRLDKVAADRAKFPPLARQQIEGNNEKMGKKEPQTYIPSAEILGREEDKKAIKNMFKDNVTTNVPVRIAIVGIGGLGKTTLARFIFDDAEGFDLKLWVWVSQNFDVERLMKEVIKEATGKESPDLGMNKLQSEVRKHLDGKKYLLVLDDIWNTNPGSWNELGNLLKGGAKGSVILATTREKDVATNMGADSQHQFQLEGLADDDCWSLFEQQLGSKLDQMEERQMFVAIGKEILNKYCGGLPLAITIVAGLLRCLDTVSGWQDVKNDKLWSDAREDNSILPSLRISYERLSPNLKKFFEFCSLFPKGSELEKVMLTQLWMAQGFIDHPSNKGRLEDSGDRCFKELRNRFFFQDDRKDEYGDVISYKMHDRIHDLAEVVARPECVTVNGDDTVPDICERVIHASINADGASAATCVDKFVNAKNLRTLLTTEGIGTTSKQDFDKVASTFKSLRALNIRHIGVLKPNSMGNLKHLRYLDLSRSDIRKLPNSICDLQNLQTLKLNCCWRLEKLPRDIKKLVKLVHLENEACDELKGMPYGIGQLTSIQTLSQFVLGGTGSGGLSELEGLNNLRGNLFIQNLQNARNAASESKKTYYLKEKKHLQTLSLYWAIGGDMCERYGDEDVALLESLQPNPDLKDLNIARYGGVEFPSWMENIEKSLTHLVRISLVDCPSCKCLPLFAEQLHFLKRLELCHLDKLEYIRSYVSDSSSSTHSYSPFNSNVLSGAIGYFPALEYVHLFYLPKLKEWRREVIVGNAGGMPKTESVATEPNVVAATTSYLPFFLTLSKLKTLKISRCNDITSLPKGWLENLISLERVEIEDCAKLESISQETSPTLKNLKSKAHDLLEEEDVQSFRSLCFMSISNLPRLTCLPKGLQHATKLDLRIESCAGLVSWLDSMGNITSLRSLVIGGFPTLTSLPRALQHFTALEELTISNWPELNISDEDDDLLVLRSLHSLSISNFPNNLASLSKLPLHTTALKILNIYSCPRLMILPDWLCNLASLQELSIFCCSELKSLPRGLQHLTALEKLDIWHCPELNFSDEDDDLPIPQVMLPTSLKNLDIRFCRYLSETCRKEIGKDWPKIAHIPTIEIDYEYLQCKPTISD